MKKRFWILLVVLSAAFAAGCAKETDEERAVVVELPIEEEIQQTEEDKQNAVYGDSKEPYEELEVTVEGNKGTIIVGTTGAPFTELLTQAKLQLAKEGWDLQIKKYDDYRMLNEDVLSGALDAHLFAHQTYVDSYNDVNGTNLTTVDRVCYEVYGVYSKVNQDLTNISGATVAIPADGTRKARALLFMQDMGWITLMEDVGMTAVLEDIVDNPKNLQFTEYDQDTLLNVMDEAAYCIIGADKAISAGLDIEEGVLQKELEYYDSADVFASLLVSSEENAQSEKMKVLVKVLESEEMKVYMEDAYRGAYEVLE